MAKVRTNQPSERPDENKQATVERNLSELLKNFTEGSSDYDDLADLLFGVKENKIIGNKLEVNIYGVQLRINARDNLETGLQKILDFIKKLNENISNIKKQVEASGSETHDTVTSTVDPLVKEKSQTFWRDVNAEIELIANAYAGVDEKFEAALRDLRHKSHKSLLGTSDYSITIGEDTLEIKQGATSDSILTKLAIFLTAVKRHNPEVNGKLSYAPKDNSDSIDPLFWRDIVAGIDSLSKAYPDENFGSLASLRGMLQKGEIGKNDRLLLSIGDIHLNILKEDNQEVMKEKIAIFIGELKQIAGASQKPKNKPLDPALERTYWRDILGAMQELTPLYGEDPKFKLLKLSIEKGVLGTVKNFQAVIGGQTLMITQSDTDSEMRDKLTQFIRDLNNGGQVAISQKIRDDYAKLEQRYKDMETKSADLASRYAQKEKDAKMQLQDIRRLKDQNSLYEQEIIRLQAELSRANTSSSSGYNNTYRPTRSYSG